MSAIKWFQSGSCILELTQLLVRNTYKMRMIIYCNKLEMRWIWVPSSMECNRNYIAGGGVGQIDDNVPPDDIINTIKHIVHRSELVLIDLEG